MVLKNLTPEQLVWWVKTNASDWNAFYCFLEKQAKEARQIQVLQTQLLAANNYWQSRSVSIAAGITAPTTASLISLTRLIVPRGDFS